MKAYTVLMGDRRVCRWVDGGYRFALPDIACRVCEPERGSWGASALEFPAVQGNFLNEREFTNTRTVSIEEFQSIKTQIEVATGRKRNLIPGGLVGVLEIDALRKSQPDFVWARIGYPQISKRAAELLARDGIELTTAPCQMLYRGKELDTHWAVEVEPFPLLTLESRERCGVWLCPVCGNYRPPEIPTKRYDLTLDRKLWPSGRHLVKARETCHLVASPEFIEAVQRHGLVGLEFKECGRFV